jgi:HEAT repeat protein
MPLIRKDAPGSPGVGRADAQAGDPRIRLVEGNVDERYAAARQLASMPDGVEALGAALALERDARVREAIFTGLARADNARSVAIMLPHLRSNDAGIRTGALDALRMMPAALRPHFDALLHDGDADIRLFACDLLREQPGDDVAALLSRVLDVETHVNVCAAAVDVLAETGNRQSVPALERCSRRFPDESFLQFAIKVAVARIGAQS